MIAPLLLATLAPVLGPIGRQQLPAQGCAAFLWAAGKTTTLVAMATADPAQLRLALDGKVIDLPRRTQQGTAPLGFAATTDYVVADLSATLSLTIVTRADLNDGAAIPEATLRIMRSGGDELVVPLAGLVGCRGKT